MILVFIPYHQKKRYAIDYVLDWVENADLTDCEVIMRWHTGVYGEKNAVKQQREFARLLAIQKDATHLFMLGADTIPPLDVIPRLLSLNLDAVGGLYFGRYGATNSKPTGAVAWKNGDQDQKWLLNGGIVELDGQGNDCMLFSRKAFTAFSYLDWVQNDDDYPAFDILKSKGIKNYVDTSIRCKHYSDHDTFSD